MIVLNDKNSLFIGTFKIVSKADEEITGNNDGSISTYYRIGLSNGRNIVEVTCGTNSPLLKLPMDQMYDMEFNLDDRNGKLKLRVTGVNAPDQGGAKQQPAAAK